MARVLIGSFMCPHCNTKCSFYGEGVRDKVVLWCNGCHGGVYFHLQNYDIQQVWDEIIRIDAKNVIDYYPRRVMTIDPSVPKDIADDYGEANRCMSVSASKATVTMCRRALEIACISEGADPKSDLIGQIDWLEAKRVINLGLKEIAHTIRMVGNWGAHPQSDPLKDVTPDDATAILEFTSEFLDEVFVRPSRLKALRTKKGLK